jgi:NADPH2:quinone reductase
VIACASSDEKLEFAKAHGAELTLNYAKEDLKEGLKRLTGGKGVDIVFDPSAAATPRRRCAPSRGRALPGDRLRGRRHSEDAAQSGAAQGLRYPRRVLGAWTRVNPEKNRANLEKLVKWTAEGKISSHVDRTFPLAQTAEALKVLAGRKAMGKVILHP